MTDSMKCPFCQQELIREGMNHWWCSCNIEHQGKELYGTTALWQALIQVKQDLEIARNALEDIKSDYELYAKQGCRMEPNETDMYNYACKALKQIEHKEQK